MTHPPRIAPFLLAMLLPPAPVIGQEGCHPATRQFDFWVGDWNVAQQIRGADVEWIELPATDVVRPAAGGCAFIEHWSGEVQFFWEGMERPEPLEGVSVRAYDEDTERWKIWWLDSSDPDFGGPFTGGFEDGVGTFTRVSTTPDGCELIGRIRFMDITPESVRWELSVSRDDGDSWVPLWRMHFTRASAIEGAAP